MEIGLLEIVLIILLIIAVLVKVRISRAVRPTAGRDESSTASPADTPDKKSTGGLPQFLRRIGILLIIAGAVALLASASLFRMVLRGYTWAIILIVIGFVLLVLSRRKG